MNCAGGYCWAEAASARSLLRPASSGGAERSFPPHAATTTTAGITSRRRIEGILNLLDGSPVPPALAPSKARRGPGVVPCWEGLTRGGVRERGHVDVPPCPQPG